MPHATLKIIPGVNTTETPALNQAGITSSNLIRSQPDPQMGALVQKLGGWSKFYPYKAVAPVRALWAWEDTNAATHLAAGTQVAGTQTVNGQNYPYSQLSVITNGNQVDITPQYSLDNVPPVVSTTAGSSVVTITDSVSENITSYDAVYIQTHLSVGGVILFGLYPCITFSPNAYKIVATDTLGNPLPAPSASSTPTVASFTTTTGSNLVTVTLANHGFLVGSTYPALVSTPVGGVTIYGNYIVQSVSSANTFTIEVGNIAQSAATVPINSGNAALIYSLSTGAVPPGSGFGVGGYGSGGYGVGPGVNPASGIKITATNWTLDNWGQVLVACPIGGSPINGILYQPIYQWDPTSGEPTATVVPQAPPLNDGVFVAMPQRQIVAWGSTFTGIQDPLLIRWSDVSNYSVWIAQVANQAGSFRIPKGSKIVGCIQGPQQALVWTDVDLWSMQYIGAPLVYSFNEIGAGCGLISRKAAGSLGESVYWMGPSQFFSLTAGGVSPIVCPVWDVVFQQVDPSNLDKIRFAANSRFNEVAWYFPTQTSGGEVAMYVKYNVLTGQWDYGNLSRSAWIDQSVLGPPIGADPNQLYIYQHETSPDADGLPLQASFQTGYATIGDGEYKTFVDQVWPDMRWGYFGLANNATIQLTFYVADYPGDTPQVYGPYTLTQSTEYISPRFRGRLVSIGVSSNDTNSFWRLGDIRYRFQPDGKY